MDVAVMVTDWLQRPHQDGNPHLGPTKPTSSKSFVREVCFLSLCLSVSLLFSLSRI